MSTQQTAITKYIEANGHTLAYRRLGPSSGIPLVLHIHFRGNMDFWDPSLINALAAQRPVIIFDNSGVGLSTGSVPPTFAGWATNLIALVHALEIPQIDLLGFSMGGCVAQMAALNAAPGLVRRLILAGTRASRSPVTVGADWPLVERFALAMTEAEVQAAFAESFFTASAFGLAHARASWDRIHEREHRELIMDQETTQAQLNAPWTDWETPGVGNSFERLGEIKVRTLVMNGDTDILVPTANSFELQREIEGADLHIYRDAGHGFLFQYGELVAKHVGLFLDAE
jgi:pimeloyl-ACP methyl ester carboxylesterase